MQYFPLSDEVYFENANTRLKKSINPHYIWSVASKSSEKAYLRQDVALLFENGKYKAVDYAWRENSQAMSFQKELAADDDIWIEAISYHHAELHLDDNKIQSAQEMTSDNLYMITLEDEAHFIKVPSSDQEKKQINYLKEKVRDELDSHWNKWIKHFKIDDSQYMYIPFQALVNYQSTVLPNKSAEETTKIIGQLWEGIYKQYVLLLNQDTKSHWMPLILYANDGSHLILLFEIAGEKYQFIQKIN